MWLPAVLLQAAGVLLLPRNPGRRFWMRRAAVRLLPGAAAASALPAGQGGARGRPGRKRALRPGLASCDRRLHRGVFFFISRDLVMRKERKPFMTEVTAGAALAGPGLAGDAGQRVCKRPGCGNLVPVAGRGRARLFCGDACSRRFHNAARPAAGGVAVSPEQAGDPLGALAALAAQAGFLLEMAREQAAALDPETVAVQLAEAEAARRRAEARAVTAEARAAEAEQEMHAALEEAAAAYRGREAAEFSARQAGEAAERARGELAGAVARARADAEAARVRAGEQAAEAAGIAEMARAERDQASTQAAALVQAADAELARARQAEADARDWVRQARDDAAREREALDGQYQARLQAMEQLAAAERDRAVRAGQLADSEREHCHRLLAALTPAGGHDDPPAQADPPSPQGRRPRARAAAAGVSP
jgi:hypothetical protein